MREFLESKGCRVEVHSVLLLMPGFEIDGFLFKEEKK